MTCPQRTFCVIDCLPAMQGPMWPLLVQLGVVCLSLDPALQLILGGCKQPLYGVLRRRRVGRLRQTRNLGQYTHELGSRGLHVDQDDQSRDISVSRNVMKLVHVCFVIVASLEVFPADMAGEIGVIWCSRVPSMPGTCRDPKLTCS